MDPSTCSGQAKRNVPIESSPAAPSTLPAVLCAPSRIAHPGSAEHQLGNDFNRHRNSEAHHRTATDPSSADNRSSIARKPAPNQSRKARFRNPSLSPPPAPGLRQPSEIMVGPDCVPGCVTAELPCWTQRVADARRPSLQSPNPPSRGRFSPTRFICPAVRRAVPLAMLAKQINADR